MANTRNVTGTLTTTGSSTEDVLATVTTAATLQLVVDCNGFAADDHAEIRIYTKVLSGGTERLLWVFSVGNDMDDIWVSPLVVNVDHAKFSITQTTGSGRSIPWSVHQVG